MNTKEQWEYEFDKLFVEQGNHRGGKVVREEASKIFDFIRETREQAYQKGYSAGLQNSVLQSGGAKPQPLTGKI